MTVKEFIAKIKDVEKNYKTVYAYGVFGAPITEKVIAEKSKQYPNWYTAQRQKMLRDLIGKGYFGFDCVNLIKGVLWGWNGDLTKIYGGAAYASNGVPDISADGFIAKCKVTGTNFKDIKIGDVVWVKGHIGVYIGDGLAIECTPKWANKVQITAVLNIGPKAGYNGRTWTKWGRNPYIDYGGENMANYEKYVLYGEVLRQGRKDSKVKLLQQDLIRLGYGDLMNPYGIDGSFGGATFKAVVALQKDNKLDPDGIPGPATQKKMLELLNSPNNDYKKLYEEEVKKREAIEKTFNKMRADIKKIVG